MSEHHSHLPHLHSGHADDPEGASADGRNPYASANRWRHQESSAFARHAAANPNQPRDGEGSRGDVKDLTEFLNRSRIDGSAPGTANSGTAAAGEGTAGRFTPIVVPQAVDAAASAPAFTTDGQVKEVASDNKDIISGPLLNYRRTEGTTWIGSALIVVRGGGKDVPQVPIAVLGPASGGASNGNVPGGSQEVQGICLYSDPRNTFWRFDLAVPMGRTESRWQYTFPGLRFESESKPRTSYFSVPAASEAMRILFFSCNGFSVGTDEDAWCGPALWNDVTRIHEKTPFHVMIGGGDQIYNDSIRVSGPLREWTAIGNPKKRHEYKFTEKLRKECDDFYLDNYIKWYSTEPFASANGQIPQLNIWDDHDIIDGFGSYVDEFMKCDVFRGIGGTAHKYYMLFQHHLPPPVSTYTSDAPHAGQADGVDSAQLVDTYVAPKMIESSYIIGSKPGPYVAEHSHNMYCQLGARMAFVGIDARTERTRHQVNYPETYDQIFARLSGEFKAAAAAGQSIKHLILLLGVPIAYPRLTWLENIFSSPLMGPVKFMNRRFGLGGGFFNYFDGSVDLLDDLDDHYTARTHKKERNFFIERLQALSAEHSVRITILGGDVHLAAIGRFYANPDLKIATENDYRFMINVVSSAITNKPPPAAVANLLARRNKIHHLNSSTDETLFKIFNKDPGTSNKTANHNQVTMPSRNFAIITENSPNNAEHEERSRPLTLAPDGPGARPTSRGSSRFGRRSLSRRRENGASSATDASAAGSAAPGSRAGSSGSKTGNGRDGHYALHAGEEGAGTEHKAAGALHGMGNDGSLDVRLCVEMDQHDPEGKTESYGLTIPSLDYTGPPPIPKMPHHFRGSRPNTGHRSTTTASS